jgi:hypothetical protein
MVGAGWTSQTGSQLQKALGRPAAGLQLLSTAAACLPGRPHDAKPIVARGCQDPCHIGAMAILGIICGMERGTAWQLCLLQQHPGLPKHIDARTGRLAAPVMSAYLALPGLGMDVYDPSEHL